MKTVLWFKMLLNMANIVMMSAIRYIIALIMIIKIFQFRHPDLTANAYKVSQLQTTRKFCSSGLFTCGTHHLPRDDGHFLRQCLLLGDHPLHLHPGHRLSELCALLQPRNGGWRWWGWGGGFTRERKCWISLEAQSQNSGQVRSNLLTKPISTVADVLLFIKGGQADVPSRPITTWSLERKLQNQ